MHASTFYALLRCIAADGEGAPTGFTAIIGVNIRAVHFDFLWD